MQRNWPGTYLARRFAVGKGLLDAVQVIRIKGRAKNADFVRFGSGERDWCIGGREALGVRAACCRCRLGTCWKSGSKLAALQTLGAVRGGAGETDAPEDAERLESVSKPPEATPLCCG